MSETAGTDFQIIAENPGFAPHSRCKKMTQWNGRLCNTTDLGMLMFESKDDDAWTRSMQPIHITGISGVSTNIDIKLNSFMDHQYDGFYTSHRRESRFPAVIQGPEG